MNGIFIRDVAIAVLLSIITAMLLHEPCAILLTLAYLFMVIGIEEYTEKIVRFVHMRRQIKKLRNRKVLPPASKTGLIKKYTVIISRRKREYNERFY